jgi:hypothetical protein
MFLLKQILPGVIAAMLIAGGLSMIAARLAALSGREKNSAWLYTAALTLAYAGGHALTAGVPAVPPADATLWLFYFAFITAFIGAIDSTVRNVPDWLRGIVWLLVFVGLMRLLLQPKFQYGWSHEEGMLWWIASAIGVFFLAWCFEKVEQRGTLRLLSPLVATIVSGGTGVALMLSGSLLLGQLALVLAGATGALTVAAWLLEELPFKGAAPTLAVLLSGLWMSGYLYAELPATSVVCLAIAPVFALSIAAGINKRFRAWKTLALAAGVAAAPVIIAVVIALRASPPIEY